jgi:hypothetical protein
MRPPSFHRQRIAAHTAPLLRPLALLEPSSAARDRSGSRLALAVPFAREALLLDDGRLPRERSILRTSKVSPEMALRGQNKADQTAASSSTSGAQSWQNRSEAGAVGGYQRGTAKAGPAARRGARRCVRAA